MNGWRAAAGDLVFALIVAVIAASCVQCHAIDSRRVAVDECRTTCGDRGVARVTVTECVCR